jgi:peptidoglycan glycosyltransferase
MNARGFLQEWRTALKDGAVDKATIDITGAPVESPSPSPTPAGLKRIATVPYLVSYFSSAADGPVMLEGSLRLEYDAAADRWTTPLSAKLLWPGMKGASGFAIHTRWEARGRILDRRGKVLARGSGDNRTYPFGVLAGSTIGHLEPLTEQEVKDGAPGTVGDLVGGSGLEEGLQTRLAGKPDELLDVVTKKGRTLRTLGTHAGHPGRDAKTTLDVNIQRAATDAYGPTVGGAVVMQPKTGDILAVVTSAELDPNNWVGVPLDPFNRALSGLYPPGSSMKVVTSSAALDTGTVTASTQLTGPQEYKGVRNFESESFASLDFATALKFSVNTAFAQVAEKLGAKRMKHYADAFGFNRVPTMPLHAATSSFPLPLDEGDLLWSAVGQAQVVATPLEMASVAATVANGGMRMEPRILLSDRPAGSRAMSRRSAATLTTLMEGVVQGGTGTAAQIPGVAVAGKTGTAEVDVNGVRKNHAWFVCFAPAGNPTLAVSVVSELGGVGGVVAAPLARGILSSSLPLAP